MSPDRLALGLLKGQSSASAVLAPLVLPDHTQADVPSRAFLDTPCAAITKATDLHIPQKLRTNFLCAAMKTWAANCKAHTSNQPYSK